MASPSLKSWRTAFLTLRDEALASPPPTSSQALLQSLVFSQNDVLVSEAADLPPHEATSDLMFFVELTKNVADGEDAAETYAHACHLIHDVSSRVCLEINSFSWGLLLDFLEKMLQYHLKPSKAPIAKASWGNAARVKVVMEILEIMRFLENGYGRKCSLQESAQFVNLLLDIIACCNTELCSSCYSSGDPPNNVAGSGSKRIKYHCLWDCQTAALDMVGEALTKMGSSVSLELWQLTLEVLRKVMDALLSKRPLVEDSKMSRFYSSLLHCLHLVLSDVKGSLSEHVAGLVASLRAFFIYGLHNQSLAHQDTRGEEKDFHSMSIKSSIVNSTSERGRYRPPHLRRREGAGISLKSDSQSYSEDEASTLYLTSSDSEHSDSDGLGNKLGNFHSSKTRIAALLCVQDLCQADPKSLTAQWTMLLPTSDVLQPRRKHEPTLMTCLLFDPILKTRVAAATTLTSVLGAASPVFLQVAEYKESTKLGPFTSLSSSVGQMLLQLHAGILYLVQHEAHSGMLAPLFKSLMLLITATPYARMPGDLLPSVISSVRTRMIKGFPSRADHNSLMVIGLSCLGAAFSTSPPSLQVQKVLQEEISIGLVGAQGEERVLAMIIHLCERITNPTISLEALQVLRAVSHHYPSIMVSCWKRVSTTIEGLLSKTCSGVPTLETTTRPLKGNLGSTLDPLGERCITAAVKVLDECLRAISGFKGTEDVLDDRSLNSPFTSDCMRTKRISSAPSYGVDGRELLKDDLARDSLGSVEWCEAIDKHLPLVLLHGSPMVRAASVTCFAGMTSSVFLSLLTDKQEFVLSSSINAALNDEVPSVRSAACRAIGVISCFPQISNREETLDKFIHAIEINANHSLASVRITACWALANVCDLLRHRADVKIDSQWIARLSECSLRLTKDGDKIKSNAVRALGNLARFVQFTSPPTAQDKLDLGSSSMTAHSICPCHQTSNYVYDFTSMGDTQWLGRMVQAFVSCVTTGNVKVQWNVCHALSNLFHNQTLKLQDMAWAPSVFSILLLLLRDSSNYKIRIQAAAALAVPVYRLDYGSSFSDVVQGLEHVLEDLGSEQISTSSRFKYSDALQKQLTAATLHVLGLISCSDHEALKDFLVKKASFFEHWLKSLCSSILDDSTHLSLETPWVENQKNSSLSSLQKKEMMSKAMKALHEFFICNSQPGIAQRIETLLDCVY